ncbi:MAG: hypothetical protein CMF31_04870 [Kordiimonas sp.]|nr:hypothetical protein [Kordiimonas sp.]
MREDTSVTNFPRQHRHRGHATLPETVFFTRDELNAILNIYGRMVAAGLWRDYAIADSRDRASFAAFQRASERPQYQILKQPQLRHKQGAYAILSMQGQVLKRGHELPNVLKYFDRKLMKLVE